MAASGVHVPEDAHDTGPIVDTMNRALRATPTTFPSKTLQLHATI
jgi:hypothetical protein